MHSSARVLSLASVALLSSQLPTFAAPPLEGRPPESAPPERLSPKLNQLNPRVPSRQAAVEIISHPRVSALDGRALIYSSCEVLSAGKTEAKAGVSLVQYSNPFLTFRSPGSCFTAIVSFSSLSEARFLFKDGAKLISSSFQFQIRKKQPIVVVVSKEGRSQRALTAEEQAKYQKEFGKVPTLIFMQQTPGIPELFLKEEGANGASEKIKLNAWPGIFKGEANERSAADRSSVI